MVLAFLKDRSYRPMRFREMAGLLQVPKEERGELNEILDRLIHEEKIAVDLEGRYIPVSATVAEGIFQATDKGYGFVTVEGEENDWFIPASYTGGAMHGDLVRVAGVRRGGDTGASENVSGRFASFSVQRRGHRRHDRSREDAAPRGPRTEGRVVAVLERNTKVLVGIFRKNKFGGRVIPDRSKCDFDVLVGPKDTLGAVSGQKVCVTITQYDGPHGPSGKITEILGHVNDPGVDILSVVRDCGLPYEWPEEVKLELATVPREVSAEEHAGRTDLRDVLTVTIDGEDTKDIDDAVSLTRENGVWKLGVHIADVSNYVLEGHPLDREAINRGTSVYLADRVIPMLPHELSDGICSLNQDEERLALSCLMEIDDNGAVIGHSIEETLIRVDRRLTYTYVQSVFDDADECTENETDQQVRSMLLLMRELAAKIRARRDARGAIDFDFPESKIILDERGRVSSIEPYPRNEATRLIEDFMVTANSTVAEEFFWLSSPFVYRIHEEPSQEKMKELAGYVSHFGYSLHVGNGEVHSMDLQKFLRKLRGKREEALLSRLTLRSMRQARYATECAGHFGLALSYYCHFTSPIRRYPDLQIHRIIKEHLHGTMNKRRETHYQAFLGEIAARSSMTERRSEEAEREVERMKKAEYMRGFLGEEYDGVISGVTSWGLYVELPNTVEGLVRLTDLRGDYYIYDAASMSLTGERSGRRYAIGDPMRVMVSAADKASRTVEFIPVR
ncbi:MAG: ribonuclease R [Lachnospiraceae bacterium]|nr:ribonuclease R [Lachnospiraceae bacterium]